MQYPRKYQAKKVMKFRVLKVESANSTMSGGQSFRGSFMIPVTTLIMQCDVCRKAGPDIIAGKTEFVAVKKSKCESLVFLNKSLKHEKCFNMVSAKAHSSINNYVQINTF